MKETPNRTNYVIYESPGDRMKTIKVSDDYKPTISLWRKVAKNLRGKAPDGWKISASIIGTLECDYKRYLGPLVMFIGDEKHIGIFTNIPTQKRVFLPCGEPDPEKLTKLIVPYIKAQTVPITKYIADIEKGSSGKALSPVKITSDTRGGLKKFLPQLKLLKSKLEKSRGFVDASWAVSDTLDIVEKYKLPKDFLDELETNYTDLRDAREENAIEHGSVSLKELKADASSNLARLIRTLEL